MNVTSHIELGEWEGRLLVTVQDYELLDFLEDHFLDLGVETSQVHLSDPIGSYQLFFPQGTTQAAVKLALETIGPQEIERIVAVNNGAGAVGRGA